VGSHWVLILLYPKNVLYCPEDDRLRSKHDAVMWPDCIYCITVMIYCVLTFFFLWRCSPTRAMASSLLRFLDHTQRQTTVGRTPLDEWSARRRDLYLTTHNTHNWQITMPPVGFEPTISAGERPQTYVLGRAANGTGVLTVYNTLYKFVTRQRDGLCQKKNTAVEFWRFKRFKST